jgi:YfiH family protein
MWTLDASREPPCWRCDDAGSAVLAFSTRQGGTSEPPFDSLNLGRSTVDDPGRVAENRHRLIRALGLSIEHLATAGQVHGTAAERVASPGHSPARDALVTTQPGLALAVSTADCLGLLYEAPGAVAAAHAGWRGVAEGMPAAALAALTAAAGCSPRQARVHLGPCIRACCYEVRDDVLARFPAPFRQHREGRWYVDIPGAARQALLDAGVSETHVHDTGACTACEPHWYFSHRRDRGATGRLWAVAALRT